MLRIDELLDGLPAFPAFYLAFAGIGLGFGPELLGMNQLPIVILSCKAFVIAVVFSDAF
jgi:hypothetical protein